MNHRRVCAQHELLKSRLGSSVAHLTTEPQLRSDELWFFGFADLAQAGSSFG
ncbi:hypothetical protein QTI66_13405 [Variovorax sp. J22R133]|uniref:hypothetical protein n=1 Tax=Variovorax brevis TaxID=3053503 RepID=UPI00257877D3|nr:hypothetical protein [Variovorax sp. J22R133]MDM0113150.1 hypothetical protein [Variovorax sp. J22R133]